MKGLKVALVVVAVVGISIALGAMTVEIAQDISFSSGPT